MSVSQSGQASAPRPRSDAARNRQRLLDVARAALAGDGETTMQSIAKSAGVGQGTIYRHFPTREALLLEVYKADFDALVAAAYDLLERHAPDAALRLWLDELAVFGRKKHALADVLDAATRPNCTTSSTTGSSARSTPSWRPESRQGRCARTCTPTRCYRWSHSCGS